MANTDPATCPIRRIFWIAITAPVLNRNQKKQGIAAAREPPSQAPHPNRCATPETQVGAGPDVWRRGKESHAANGGSALLLLCDGPPALIFLSAIVASLPVAGLFDQVLDLMGRFVPREGMDIVRKVLADVVTPNRGTFLSLGFLATLWTASGGFAAAIEALNVAYDADETRPFWKTRPLAMMLTLLIGLLLLVALAVNYHEIWITLSLATV